MSAEGFIRRGSIAMTCVALLTMASAASAHGAEDKVIDMDHVGTAAVVGPMFRDIVGQIAERCGRLVPESAAQWRDDLAGWETRNASWLIASEAVLDILTQEVRMRGADLDATKRHLDGQIAVFVNGTVEVAAKDPDTCAKAQQRIAAGLLDISVNKDTYAPEADVLLREHLPPASGP